MLKRKLSILLLCGLYFIKDYFMLRFFIILILMGKIEVGLYYFCNWFLCEWNVLVYFKFDLCEEVKRCSIIIKIVIFIKICWMLFSS